MSFTGVIDAIYAFCQNAMQIMGYPGLALVMFIENVFPPIPSEVVLPLAGTLTVSADPSVPAQFNIVSTIIWASVGTFAGAWLWYWIGYLIGEERIRSVLKKIGKYIKITENDLDYSISWFEKYGEFCVFFGRMVPIIRTLISIPAGLSKMNWLKFSLLTVAGTGIWNTLLAFAGRILGDNYTVIVDYIDQYKKVVIVVCVAAVVVFYVRRFMKSRKSGDAAEAVSDEQSVDDSQK